MNKKLAAILCTSLAWQAFPAMAATGLEGVSLSGFLTAGATYADKQLLTNSNTVSQDGTIENTPGFTSDSCLGVQISAKVNSDVSVTGQLLAKAREDNSNVKADWAFVTYRVSDPVSVRAGKIKFPTFLISDYYEVGYAYPWIRPPQEVYSLNPIVCVIDGFRWCLLGGQSTLYLPGFAASLAMVALFLWLGVSKFRSMEKSFADII